MTIGLSRVFRRGPNPEDGGVNTRTLAGSDRLLAQEQDRHFDAEALFHDQYETIKMGLNAHLEQGVLIVAVDRHGRALAQGWLRASLDKTRAAIVGRHTACGIAVPTADRNVSLRHLAVLVRASSHTDAYVRILDLHTSRAFTDESGEVLSAARAEGSLFIGLDGLRLAFLMTGEPAPESAAHAYAAIPPRVLFEERRGTLGIEPRRASRSAIAVPDDQPSELSVDRTLVRSSDGPVAAVADLCSPDEPPAGTLVIRGPRRTVRRSVGARALERGILVGRYDRCAVGLDTGRLSRVHFLIVRDGDQIVGIDTASTNGSWLGEREVTLTTLEDGTSVDLAQALKLTWHEA